MTKINEDDRPIKDVYIERLKQVKLADAGISIDKVDEYTKFIMADTEAEITEQAERVASDVGGKAYVDPSVSTWRPFE